jgi:RNA-directed DNA polymerase
MTFSFLDLHHSYRKASQKHKKKASVSRFWFYLERELLTLCKEIEDERYFPKPKKEFLVKEPKPRKIFESHFRDRVIHHAVYRKLNPKFERRSLPKSFACRKGFGNLKALKGVEKTFQRLSESSGNIWILKLDIKKYFDSICHKKLLELIKRDIQEGDPLIWVIERIIKSHEVTPRKGLPIGNLTSQIFANLYLNELDHYVVHHLRFPHFFRFMDDFIIISTNKTSLENLLIKIHQFCFEKLDLVVHPNKIKLVPMNHSFEFLGFQINSFKRSIKTANIVRIKRRLKKFSKHIEKNLISSKKIHESLTSWLGYARHGHVEKQLKQIYDGTHSLHPKLRAICYSAFWPHVTEPIHVQEQKQLNEKTFHNVGYRSPLDREIIESKCEFFQALQWLPEDCVNESLLIQWPK